MDIVKRKRAETGLARRVILDAIKAGYSVNVDNGGDSEELPSPSTNPTEVLGVMFAADDEHLIMYKGGKRVGWVHLVYGNGGWDAISDYTYNLEPIMERASVLSEAYEKGLEG